MAEDVTSPGEGRPSGLRGLLGRTGGLPARIGRLVAPVATGRRGVAAGRSESRAMGAAHDPGYRVVAGVRTDRGSVAISFGGGSLRVLQYVGRRVIGWASVPLPEGVVRGGAVVDAPALGGVLEETFDRLRLPRRHVVGAISGLRASASLLELPWVKDGELAEVVADEATRALGAAPDDSYLFWQRIPGRRRERFVYALAVPREPLLIALEAFEAGGLRADVLDLKPLALARAVNQQDAIIANLESDSLDVTIVVDDLPVLFRSLALPAGLAHREPAHDLLVAEVCRALVSYEDAAPGHLLDGSAAIYLSGSDVGSIALAERLRAQTGHPIGRPTPPMHYPSDFPLAEQLVNVGLALKGC